MKDFRSIKTAEDAFNEAGIDMADVIGYKDSKDVIAYKKLKVITEVLNAGWVCDNLDTEQEKFWPYWIRDSGNLGCIGIGKAQLMIGSLLVLKSREIAVYAGNQFIDLYKEFLGF
jgi:hypothetical protein